MKKVDGGFKSSLKISAETIASFYEGRRIDPGDLVLLVADSETQSLVLAGKLREFLGKKFQTRTGWNSSG